MKLLVGATAMAALSFSSLAFSFTNSFLGFDPVEECVVVRELERCGMVDEENCPNGSACRMEYSWDCVDSAGNGTGKFTHEFLRCEG